MTAGVVWVSHTREGHALAHCSRRELHESILDGVASGLRSGVDVSVVKGLQAIRSLEGFVELNQTEDRIAGLTGDVERLRQQAKRARALAREELDDEVADGYRADARTLTAEARRLEDEIRRVRERSATKESLADQFTCEVDLLLRSLGSLLASDRLVEREEADALNQVLRELRVEIDPGDASQLRWSLELRVPSDVTVLRIGPFTGTVRRTGRTAPPGELTASNGAPLYLNGSDRRKVTHQLQELGYTDAVIRAATRAPFAELLEALVGGEPDWVDAGGGGASRGTPVGFDAGAFNAHLRARYGDGRWYGRIHSKSSQRRQILTDLVAALGGSARNDQLVVAARQVGLHPSDASRLSQPLRSGSSLPWLASVRRTGAWSATDDRWRSGLESIRCASCELPATAVVHAIEIPGSLLCRRCLISPHAPDLVFPACYGDLALPQVDFDADLIDELVNLPLVNARSQSRLQYFERTRQH